MGHKYTGEQTSLVLMLIELLFFGKAQREQGLSPSTSLLVSLQYINNINRQELTPERCLITKTEEKGVSMAPFHRFFALSLPKLHYYEGLRLTSWLLFLLFTAFFFFFFAVFTLTDVLVAEG